MDYKGSMKPLGRAAMVNQAASAMRFAV